MTVTYRCVQNQTLKRDVVDAAGSLVMVQRMALRSDGAFIPVEESTQEKYGEKVYLFVDANEAAGKRDTEQFVSMIVTDPAKWGHFVVGKVYDLTFG